MSTINVGDQVVAQNEITEVTNGRVHVHAKPGDAGEVVDSTPPFHTVAWNRSAALCHADELGTEAPIAPNTETVERIR